MFDLKKTVIMGLALALAVLVPGVASAITVTVSSVSDDYVVGAVPVHAVTCEVSFNSFHLQ